MSTSLAMVVALSKKYAGSGGSGSGADANSIRDLKEEMYNKFDELGTASTKNAGNEVGQLPVIGEDGKLATGILPSIAINNTFVVANKEEAMRQVVEVGDVIIINNVATSESATYICVDLGDGKATFDEKFRPLLSKSDTISKADLETSLLSKSDKTTVEEMKNTLEGKMNNKITVGRDIGTTKPIEIFFKEI